MKPTLALLACALLLSTAAAASSAPAISQVVAFACNHNFSSCPDGFDPALGPIQLSNGELYGTTWWAGQGPSSAGGTVFKTSTSGAISVVHTFAAGSGNTFLNGENPVLGFVLGADGAFYGVTEQGGANTFGVMYRLTSSGKFKVVYNFCSLSGCPDGPAALVLGGDGNFYGAEAQTIFRITPQGQWSAVYTLNQTTEGTAASLILGADGNFYGTGSIGLLMGTVFQVTPAGQFTILYTFPEFETVSSNLVQATDGNFYGGTSQGNIFQITATGAYKVIAKLTQADGPQANFLLQASDGNLWGLSESGGTDADRPGTVFAVSTSGTVLTSAEFKCSSVGCNPEKMIQGSDGKFYGVAIKGGKAAGHPMGTVFSIDAGLAPPQR